MTAKHKEHGMPTATLTAASYKAQNLRRMMREAQSVLVDFSSRAGALSLQKKMPLISSPAQQLLQLNQLFKRLQARCDYERVCLKIASGGMERALPDKKKTVWRQTTDTRFLLCNARFAGLSD